MVWKNESVVIGSMSHRRVLEECGKIVERMAEGGPVRPDELVRDIGMLRWGASIATVLEQAMTKGAGEMGLIIDRAEFPDLTVDCEVRMARPEEIPPEKKKKWWQK